ncbi:MAG: ankyrin repeat domain-containing protein [Saprospiraceae bacterium]|nr:ankyrin repeat domain-containing protein [Saprospiraceae bacterium]
MKSIKITYLKTVFSFALAVILLTSACNESNKSTENKPTVAKPKIDIQTAILSDNLDIVKQHIHAGTDINRKDQISGSTPLITAATFGKTAIVQALINANVDLTTKNNDGATALHTAAFFCRVEIVQLLMDAKADKTIKNNFGVTARESVMGPFADMKPFYEMLQQQLSPLGLQLDLNEIEKTRPVIAMMLQ